MAERPWIPLKSHGKWAGGFCHLLRGCLETVGVEADQVCYEGRTIGPLEQSSTFLTVTVPVDPRVPWFKGVKVHYFESSTMEAHQVCARRALKDVYNQLGEKLKDTPCSVLPMMVYDPSRWDTYDHAKYFELTTEVEDKKLHMADRCILAQDQALYWAGSEITFLRWKWDRTLHLAKELELEKLELEDRLEQAHQRNGQLVQLGLAAARASSERDAMKIATLDTRLRTVEEKHRVIVDTTRADRERLAEAKYLIESVGAPAADYQEKFWDSKERGGEYTRSRTCYQDPHGLGAFGPADTKGVGGDLSTATTEEEAMSASRDL
jgi:cell division septum initiation protein DivIVA